MFSKPEQTLKKMKHKMNIKKLCFLDECTARLTNTFINASSSANI